MVQAAHFRRLGQAMGCGLVLALAACQTNPITCEQKREIRGTMRSFQSSLNHRSASELQPLLAPSVQLNGCPTQLSMDALLSGVQGLPVHVVDTQILSACRTADGVKAKVALYTGRGAFELTVQFDQNGKISSIDFVPWGKGPKISTPASFTSSFVASRGLMFVRATVNGRTGYFLFDTGSSNLLLNSKYFAPNSPREIMDFESTITGMERPLGNVRVHSLRWGGLHAEGIEGKLQDFSHLECAENTPLLGAISHHEVEDCAVVIDWKRQVLQVFATKPNGAKKIADAEPPPTAVIPFSYFLHLPLMKAQIGGKQFSMLFDSGAQSNLLPTDDGLGDHFHQVGFRNLSGSGQGGQALVIAGQVDETDLGEAKFRDLPYAIFQVPYIDGKGLFGSPLFQQSRMEINFRARKISLWQ